MNCLQLLIVRVRNLRIIAFSATRSFSEERVAFFLDIDFINHVALVAVLEENGGQGIGTGRSPKPSGRSTSTHRGILKQFVERCDPINATNSFAEAFGPQQVAHAAPRSDNSKANITIAEFIAQTKQHT